MSHPSQRKLESFKLRLRIGKPLLIRLEDLKECCLVNFACSEEEPCITFPTHSCSGPSCLGSESQSSISAEQGIYPFISVAGKTQQFSESMESALFAQRSEMCGELSHEERESIGLNAVDKASAGHILPREVPGEMSRRTLELKDYCSSLLCRVHLGFQNTPSQNVLCPVSVTVRGFTIRVPRGRIPSATS